MVSATLDEHGSKCIDAAELHRAYGSFEAPATSGDNIGDTETASVVAELRQIREAVKLLTEENRKQSAELAAIKQELRERPRLTHNPVKTIAASHPFTHYPQGGVKSHV
ncbi:hypothetical protein [Candidatus Sororendozoicomonas aggregata]|uniref:hypothetical protein n=1 Tax=Candidatus Sororendozoicomonas aggregata TaxID=3073239 RepID=UPI002ED3FED6